MANKVKIEGFGTISFPDDATEEEMTRVIAEEVPKAQRAQKGQRLRGELATLQNRIPVPEAALGAVGSAAEFLNETITPKAIAEFPRRVANIPHNISAIIGSVPYDQPPPFSAPLPRVQGTGVASGLANVGIGLLSSAPELAAAATPVGPLLMTTWSQQAMENLPEAAQVAGEASVVGNPAEKAEAYANLALQSAVAGAPAIHATIPAELAALKDRVSTVVNPVKAVDALRRADMRQQGNQAAYDVIAREALDPSRAQVVIPPPELIGPSKPSGVKVPQKRSAPVIPETPPEEVVPILREIRNADARTTKQVQALFPESKLTREEARALRNQAFPKIEQPKETTNAIQERQTETVHEDVRAQPGEGEGAMPAAESASGVQRSEQAQVAEIAGEIPLTPSEVVAQPAPSTTPPPLPEQPQAAATTPPPLPTEAAPKATPPPLPTEPAQPEIRGMGGAVPGEFGPPGLPATGLKNAEIDANRTQRGLPPILKPERQRNPELFDKVMMMLDRDSDWPIRLLDELEAEPRVITPEEHVALVHHYTDLRNEYYKSAARENAARQDGRIADAESDAALTTLWSNKMARMEKIMGRGGVGTAAGRALAIRRIMMNDDFSLANLESQMIRDRGEDYEITPTDRASLQALVDKFKQKSDELEARLNSSDAARREKDLAKGIEDIKKWAAKERKDRTKKDVPLDQRIASAEARLRKAFESGNQTAIGALAKRLERYFYESGITERDPLVNAVNDVLRGIDPTWTKTRTIDAMNGYGQFRLLTHDEISDGIREINGQLLQIRKLQDMAAGKPPLKTGHERAVPGAEQRRLIKLVNEAKRRFQVPITDPETQLKSSLDTLKTRMQNQIQDFNDMIKNGDYELRKRREPIKRDAEADRLQIELDNIKHDWARKRFEWQKSRWDLLQKARYVGANIVGLHRGLLTSMEMSAMLRQGKPYFLAHPLKHISAAPDAFKALSSESNRQQVDLEIRQRQNFRLYQRDGLYLAEHGVPLSKLEEAFRSNWVNKIPGLAMSERAYTTFLNRIRADWYDTLANKLTKGREITPEEGKLIANAVNVMTGRGNIPMMERAMGDLANVFFAPRYVASRFQMALGTPVWSRSVPWKGTGKVRMLIAKEYARVFAGAALYYGLVGMGLAMLGGRGIKIGTNPSSTEFGKITIGKTRIDPMAGISQVVVLLDRLFTGNYTDEKGKTKKLKGKQYIDVVSRWLRLKLGPTASLAVNLRTGESPVGPKQPLSEMLSDQIIPITYQGMLDLMEDQGLPRGLALMVLAFFGEGVNTYEDRKK